MKRVFEQKWDQNNFKSEDGGQAFIYELADDEETRMFVRLQSWDPTLEHKDFIPFVRKRLRVTIETIDE